MNVKAIYDYEHPKSWFAHRRNYLTAPDNTEASSHLLSRPVSSYLPSLSHSPSLSFFHPLFFPLWVCALWKTGGTTIHFAVTGMEFVF